MPIQTTTSHDRVTNVKKYVPNADEAAIHGIVKHLGSALHGKDSSYVACTDKKERDLVRDHFLKKKLGLTLDHDELDQSVVLNKSVEFSASFCNFRTPDLAGFHD
jgi:hypothetical protein